MYDIQAALKRIHEGVAGEFDLQQVADWIKTNTMVRGQAFSFKGREFQQRILQSEAPTIVVKKCSQVGLTELALRRALALMDIIDGFSVFYTLPTEGFAQKVTKARIDPIIEGSARLRAKMSKAVDSASVKRIGNSFMYITGTKTTNSVISFPADAVFIDEYDFSDAANVENLQSRLTASQYRWWFYLSTPTIPNFGIGAKFQTTKRHYNHCKCNHCGIWFIPDYLQHVRIPNFEKDLLSINAQTLSTIDWKQATLFCPHCHKIPNLLPSHRAWVCENTSDNFDGDGFQVNPFDAPTIITPSDLVLWSTRFKRKINFVNYHLGQVMEDNDSGINEEDLALMEQVGHLHISGFKVFGLDMGTECHLTVGVTDGQGRLTIIAKHRIDYRDIENKLTQYIRQYRPTTIVADSQPYVETIHRLQSLIPNLFGSVYVTTKDIQPYRMIEQSQNPQRSLLEKRQINVNRNVALNILMDDIRAGKIGVVRDQEHSLFVKQMQDMKRQPVNSKSFNGEMEDDDGAAESYVWVKTTGNDHYHHSLLYCHIASQIVHHQPTSSGLPTFLSSFRVK